MTIFDILGYSIDLDYSESSQTDLYFALVPTVSPTPSTFVPIIIFVL